MFAPDGRNDDQKLDMASLAVEGQSIFQSVQEFLSAEGRIIQDAILNRDQQKQKVRDFIGARSGEIKLPTVNWQFFDFRYNHSNTIYNRIELTSVPQLLSLTTWIQF